MGERTARETLDSRTDKRKKHDGLKVTVMYVGKCE
jgi:hypothetical protein